MSERCDCDVRLGSCRLLHGRRLRRSTQINQTALTVMYDCIEAEEVGVLVLPTLTSFPYVRNRERPNSAPSGPVAVTRTINSEAT